MFCAWPPRFSKLSGAPRQPIRRTSDLRPLLVLGRSAPWILSSWPLWSSTPTAGCWLFVCLHEFWPLPACLLAGHRTAPSLCWSARFDRLGVHPLTSASSIRTFARSDPRDLVLSCSGPRVLQPPAALIIGRAGPQLLRRYDMRAVPALGRSGVSASSALVFGWTPQLLRRSVSTELCLRFPSSVTSVVDRYALRPLSSSAASARG